MLRIILISAHLTGCDPRFIIAFDIRPLGVEIIGPNRLINVCK